MPNDMFDITKESEKDGSCQVMTPLAWAASQWSTTELQQPDNPQSSQSSMVVPNAHSGRNSVVRALACMQHFTFLLEHNIKMLKHLML